MKLHVWQFLPTGPTGFGDSPYQALSAFAGNEMLIGLEPLVREGLLKQSQLQSLADLPDHTVEYETLIPIKKKLLNLAADHFLNQSSEKTLGEFRSFCDAADSWWLHNYAMFRVLKALNNDQAWTQWKTGKNVRNQVAIGRVEERCRHDIEQVKVIQFFFHRQWQRLRNHARKKGVQLFGDIPIYIALDSADAWCERGLLKISSSGKPTHVAGVPPDYFSEDGQLWGNPLYDWKRQEKNHFRWWIARLRQAASRYDMVRIDHFRGIESYWSIPAGESTARTGEWLPGPGDVFLDAIADHTDGLAIVAEDLGVITDAVTELRHRHNLPGMRVLQFELFDSKFTPEEIPEDCVCYTGTHDNDTTVGWLSGKSGDKVARREAKKLQRNALRLTGGNAKTIHLDLIRLAFSTRARIAIAPMQDYLGLGPETRLNNPGTTDGNWRWRLLPEQLGPQVQKEIAGLVKSQGRDYSEEAI